MMCAMFSIYFRQIASTNSPSPSYSALSFKEPKRIYHLLCGLAKTTLIFQYSDMSLYGGWENSWEKIIWKNICGFIIIPYILVLRLVIYETSKSRLLK